MEQLEEKIAKEAEVISDDILQVDTFLHRQIDPSLMDAMGKALAKRFADHGITKVVTVATGGIAPAVFTAMYLNVRCLIVDKSDVMPLDDRCSITVTSKTQQKNFVLSIENGYLNEEDRVLIVDDFLANGNTVAGVAELCHMAKASVEGIGICIEKCFQDGGKKLREAGYDVQSLALIRTMSETAISFRMQKEAFADVF